MPRKVFVAGEILTASDVNTNLMDQSVMVFDDATARTTAIPTPVEGMVTYLKDANQVQAFTGSAFTPVGGILQVVSTTKTDTFSTASTTFVDVTGFSVSITPSSTVSKILVLTSIQASENTSNSNAEMILLRGSDRVPVAAASNLFSLLRGTGDSSDVYNYALNLLDEPGSTSSLTYKVQVLTDAGTIFINRQASPATRTFVSTITVMEVAG